MSLRFRLRRFNPPQRIPLHIHRLIKAQHAIPPQKPIHPIRRTIPLRHAYLQPPFHLLSVLRSAVSDIANKHQTRRLNTLDERRRQVEQSGTANQPHEVVVARDLDCFFDRDGGATRGLNGCGDGVGGVGVGAEFVAEEDGI